MRKFSLGLLVLTILAFIVVATSPPTVSPPDTKIGSAITAAATAVVPHQLTYAGVILVHVAEAQPAEEQQLNYTYTQDKSIAKPAGTLPKRSASFVAKSANMTPQHIMLIARPMLA